MSDYKEEKQIIPNSDLNHPSTSSSSSSDSSQNKMSTFDELIADISNSKTSSRNHRDNPDTHMKEEYNDNCDDDEHSDNIDQDDDEDDDIEFGTVTSEESFKVTSKLVNKLNYKSLKKMIKLDKIYNDIAEKDNASSRIYKELRDIYSSNNFKHGLLSVDLQFNNLFRWNWSIKFKDVSCSLAEDLKLIKDLNRGDGFIRFNIGFQKTYPFSAPIIIITSPQIGGHVPVARDLFKLLNKEWSCHYSIVQIMEEILLMIKNERIDNLWSIEATDLLFSKFERDEATTDPRHARLSQIRSSLIRLRPLLDARQAQERLRQQAIEMHEQEIEELYVSSGEESESSDRQALVHLRQMRQSRSRLRLLEHIRLIQANRDQDNIEVFDSSDSGQDQSAEQVISVQERLQRELYERQNELQDLDQEFERLSQEVEVLQESSSSPSINSINRNQQQPQHRGSQSHRPQLPANRSADAPAQAVPERVEGSGNVSEQERLNDIIMRPMNQQERENHSRQQLPEFLENLNEPQSNQLIEQLRNIIRDLP